MIALLVFIEICYSVVSFKCIYGMLSFSSVNVCRFMRSVIFNKSCKREKFMFVMSNLIIIYIHIPYYPAYNTHFYTLQNLR